MRLCPSASKVVWQHQSGSWNPSGQPVYVDAHIASFFRCTPVGRTGSTGSCTHMTILARRPSRVLAICWTSCRSCQPPPATVVRTATRSGRDARVPAPLCTHASCLPNLPPCTVPQPAGRPGLHVRTVVPFPGPSYHTEQAEEAYMR